MGDSLARLGGTQGQSCGLDATGLAPNTAEITAATTTEITATISASQVTRGVLRLFARNDIWCLTEMPLRGGRRADIMGVDAKGRIVIVEIKVARADLLGDSKWTDYLEFCDRFYWGLAPQLDRACMQTETFRPEVCGLIVADGYDAEILRPAASLPLAATRRKAEVERLARASMRRQVVAGDPMLSAWDSDDH